MESVPYIKVEPPGPIARSIIEKDQKLLMQSYVRWYPLVIKTGKGAVVEDVDGNKYIDMNAGLAVMALGHNHPNVVEAIKKQAEKLQHYSLTDFYYEEAVTAAEKLLSISPIKDGRVFYTNSGAESIEGALKISRYYHEGKRQYIMAFLGAFHGRTMGSLSLTASKSHYREHYSPLIPGVIHVPYPYPYRCPFKAEEPKECGEAVLGFIEDWIFQKLVEPSEVSSIFFEPIQGEGGYIVPPDNFIPGLRRIADKNGILLVDDEVQSGTARTGKWYAIEHWGVVPDMIAMAKAVGGGLPLGAIVGKSEVMNPMKKGSHANTFGGNPIALAAMKAVIETIESEKILARVTKLGEMVMKYFNELKEELEIIGDVRGKGLMIGVELVRDRKTKEPAVKEIGRILNKSFKRGVLVIGAGVSSIRIAPPLVIEEDLLAKAIEIIGEILKEENKEIKK
ncbi:MAG: acetyl ornithine aminotransferase family protein [Caldisphaeraceae archaeon]|nr:acetyl ornithine aminotransferase family protein [Caldisphaeraceae archaeon]MEB3798339.1 acetyl ornithine aminotransferase family protein [Caldisphaeraceae archaeon]